MKLLPTLLLSATFVASAHASDTEAADTWKLLPNTDAKAVYSTSTEGPALVLSCSAEGKVSAMISLDGNIPEKLASPRSNTLFLKTTLTVGDKEPSIDKWRYYTRTKLASPIDNKLKRRLYNAAITGSEVTIDLGRRGEHSFTPPSMNDDFMTFANGCVAQ